ncbi:growth-regulating factor 1-like [Aristolochia californica]|uniref:growth-regulating factor 1-like n=1 Tax=Aristolochia californica TaxID=171875 RepID=UPI0035E27165
MLPARNRSPFTASQWKELEHQALIFKYMMSGVPIPSDLLYPIRRSFDPITSRLFPHQPVGWGCLGFGRKADPEPGRCRRTDGKKWRCSKEAFPDSKYCERHMHRGKNRSRKPVEIPITSSTPSKPPMTASQSSVFSSSAAVASQNRYHPYNSPALHPFLYPHASSSRPPEIGFPQQSNHILFNLDSASYSTAEKDYRYLNGGRDIVDEQPFFSEASGTLRGIGDSLTPLRLSSPLKQKSCSVLPSTYSQLHLHNQYDNQHSQHCFVLGTDFKSDRPVKAEREEGTRRFFDEWPKNKASWMNLEEDRSTRASLSTTQLSISIPVGSSDYPVLKSSSSS